MKVAILGSGNIGTDLMYKLDRSELLDVVLMAGIDERSEGLALARERGHRTATTGADAILALAEPPGIVFDATSAAAHRKHAPKLTVAGVGHIVDLTPAALGPYVFPTVNLDQHLDEPNLNLVSCASQATVPLVVAMGRVGRLGYVETVSTVASRSAGPGTRANINEFTHKTGNALETMGGATLGKAIILLNPGDPPPVMRNTIYVEFGADVGEAEIERHLRDEVARIQVYAPGFRLRGFVAKPTSVTIFTEVAGSGDYLPMYAGNLDIITSAARAVGERIVVTRDERGDAR
ncbi:acetaldehyde dehydrogenase (acetylating) [Actinomadura sp. B10D3]|uniref:acetaldehyde dehydrogenase (acetylating) n=1 Tax=Actinomadura sp. B10D3 TaxID=3153557 RepID=UPI00325D2321